MLHVSITCIHCTEPDSGSVLTLNNKFHNLSVDDEVYRHTNLLHHEASSPVVHVVLPLTVAYHDLQPKLPAVVYHSSREQNSVHLYPLLNLDQYCFVQLSPLNWQLTSLSSN